MVDAWSYFFYHENQEAHGENRLKPKEYVPNTVYLASVR